MLFARPTQVIHRTGGAYVNGVWTAPLEPAPVTVALLIQPAMRGDVERMEATASGRRTNNMVRAYADVDVELGVAGNGHPGDIVLYDNTRWLVVGAARWDVLGDPDTSHRRYLLAEEAERAAGEVMA
jgi:hypothetical protein